MRIPDELAQRTARDRKMAKNRIYRDAERQRAALRVPDAGALHKPSVLLLGMAALALAGGLLLQRAIRTSRPSTDHAQTETALRNLETLRIALERFHRDGGRYPDPETEGLHALIRDPGVAGWRGPYVNMIRPDPWGREFRYDLREGRVELFTPGPDGVEGTEADIAAVEPSDEAVQADRRRRAADPDETVERTYPVNIGP